MMGILSLRKLMQCHNDEISALVTCFLANQVSQIQEETKRASNTARPKDLLPREGYATMPKPNGKILVPSFRGLK